MLYPTFNGKNILEQGNSNWSELDDPTINKAMDKAELAPDRRSARRPGPRSTSRSPRRRRAIPWIWDKQPLIQSANVNGVGVGVQLPVGAGLDVAQVSRASLLERVDRWPRPCGAIAV